MTIRIALAAVGLAVAVQPLWAGCSNFTDGSMAGPAPEVWICYDDVCDLTTLDFECANTGSYQARYAIGWGVNCLLDGAGGQTCVITWQGREIDPAKHDRLTIVPLDGGS